MRKVTAIASPRQERLRCLSLSPLCSTNHCSALLLPSLHARNAMHESIPLRASADYPAARQHPALGVSCTSPNTIIAFCHLSCVPHMGHTRARICDKEPLERVIAALTPSTQPFPAKNTATPSPQLSQPSRLIPSNESPRKNRFRPPMSPHASPRKMQADRFPQRLGPHEIDRNDLTNTIDDAPSRTATATRPRPRRRC